MTNEQIVRAYLDAFNAGDLDAFDAIIDAGYHNNDPLRPELSDGIDALKTVVAEMRGMFPSLRYEIVQIIGEGDTLVAHTLVHGVADHPVRQIQIERIRDGRIHEHWRATNPG